MNDPLTVFQQYDVMGNGKLNLIEFKRMLSSLYSVDENLSEKEIVETFQNIANRENVVEYKQSVHDLHSQLKRLKSFPSREQFLKLLINVMAQKHTEKYHDLTLSPSETVEDPIKSIKRIHRIFMERIESNQTFQFANFTVEELWRWIEDHGIVALEENDRLQHEIATLRHSKSVNDSKQTMLQSELDVKDHAVNELKKMEEDLRADLNLEKGNHSDLFRRYNALHETYISDKLRLDRVQKEMSKLKEQLRGFEQMKLDNNLMKETISSLLSQVGTLKDLNDIQRRHLNDRPNLTPTDRVLLRQPTNHDGGFALHDSTDESQESNDDEDRDLLDGDDDDTTFHESHHRRSEASTSVMRIDGIRELMDQRSQSRRSTSKMEPETLQFAFLGDAMEMDPSPSHHRSMDIDRHHSPSHHRDSAVSVTSRYQDIPFTDDQIERITQSLKAVQVTPEHMQSILAQQSESAERTLEQFRSSLMKQIEEQRVEMESLRELLVEKERALETYRDHEDIMEYIKSNMVQKQGGNEEITKLRKQSVAMENTLKQFQSSWMEQRQQDNAQIEGLQHTLKERETEIEHLKAQIGTIDVVEANDDTKENRNPLIIKSMDELKQMMHSAITALKSMQLKIEKIKTDENGVQDCNALTMTIKAMLDEALQSIFDCFHEKSAQHEKLIMEFRESIQDDGDVDLLRRVLSELVDDAKTAIIDNVEQAVTPRVNETQPVNRMWMKNELMRIQQAMISVGGVIAQQISKNIQKDVVDAVRVSLVKWEGMGKEHELQEEETQVIKAKREVTYSSTANGGRTARSDTAIVPISNVPVASTLYGAPTLSKMATHQSLQVSQREIVVEEVTRKDNTGQEVIAYLMQEIPKLVVDSVRESFVKYTVEMEGQRDVDVESVASSCHDQETDENGDVDSSEKSEIENISENVMVKFMHEIREAIQSTNILIHQSNEAMKAREQRDRFAMERREQHQIEDELNQIRQIVDSMKYPPTQPISEMLLQPEIDKLSMKLDGVLESLNNEYSKREGAETELQQTMVDSHKKIQCEVLELRQDIQNQADLITSLKGQLQIIQKSTESTEDQRLMISELVGEAKTAILLPIQQIMASNELEQRDVSQRMTQIDDSTQTITAKIDDLKKRVDTQCGKEENGINEVKLTLQSVLDKLIETGSETNRNLNKLKEDMAKSFTTLKLPEDSLLTMNSNIEGLRKAISVESTKDEADDGEDRDITKLREEMRESVQSTCDTVQQSYESMSRQIDDRLRSIKSDIERLYIERNGKDEEDGVEVKEDSMMAIKKQLSDALQSILSRINDKSSQHVRLLSEFKDQMMESAVSLHVYDEDVLSKDHFSQCLGDAKSEILRQIEAKLSSQDRQETLDDNLCRLCEMEQHIESLKAVQESMKQGIPPMTMRIEQMLTNHVGNVEELFEDKMSAKAMLAKERERELKVLISVHRQHAEKMQNLYEETVQREERWMTIVQDQEWTEKLQDLIQQNEVILQSTLEKMEKTNAFVDPKNSRTVKEHQHEAQQDLTNTIKSVLNETLKNVIDKFDEHFSALKEGRKEGLNEESIRCICSEIIDGVKTECLDHVEQLLVTYDERKEIGQIREILDSMQSKSPSSDFIQSVLHQITGLSSKMEEVIASRGAMTECVKSIESQVEALADCRVDKEEYLLLNTKLMLKEEQLERLRQQNNEIFEWAKTNGSERAMSSVSEDTAIAALQSMLSVISEKVDNHVDLDGERFQSLVNEMSELKGAVLDFVVYEHRQDVDRKILHPPNVIEPVRAVPIAVVQQMNELWHRELIETEHGLIESDWRTLERGAFPERTLTRIVMGHEHAEQ